MGFLDFLSGGKKPSNCAVVADTIWLTTDAKFAGLAKEVAKRASSETVAILLVAHFPDVLARLDEIAAESRAVPVKAVLAGNLTPDITAGLNLDESVTIDIIVAERHPMPSVDESLEQFAGALPCRSRLSHHLSLEDPVIKVFTSAWVQNLLGKLGMTEDQPVEGQMILRRIRSAQKKIASRSLGNMDADSAAEWLKKNCPGLGYE